MENFMVHLTNKEILGQLKANPKTSSFVEKGAKDLQYKNGAARPVSNEVTKKMFMEGQHYPGTDRDFDANLAYKMVERAENSAQDKNMQRKGLER